MRTKETTQRGFTLVETFVAMTILLVAIVAPMTIAQRGLQSSFFSKERITATYLAQEGIEALRLYRDTHMLDGDDWIEMGSADFRTECIATGSDGLDDIDGCGFNMNDIDDMDNAFVACDADGEGCRLYYTEAPVDGEFMYHHESALGPPSPYTRIIRIKEIASGREAVVEVTVTWYSGLFREERSVVLTDHLLNYYDL